MDFVESSLANPSNLVGSTLSGVTIVASTSSGMTFVDGSISSGTTISPAGLGAQQFVSVHRGGSGQSINASTLTKVQHNTEAFDAAGVYDNATNYRMTPTIAGKYHVVAALLYSNMDDQEMIETHIYKNGSSVAFFRASISGNAIDRCAYVAADIDMNGSTDYLEHYAYHTHGSARNITGDSFSCFFQAIRISA